jgi:tetratricopeptide (TPR) repeat protein
MSFPARSVLAATACAVVALALGTGAGRAPRADVAELLGPPRPGVSLCKGAANGRNLRAELRGLALARVAAAAETGPVPALVDGLGPRRVTITTPSEQAQRYFDQGLAWAYGFYHAEAVRAFRASQQLDPACAMCWWGEALALGPNINMPMVEAAVAPARAALARAQELAAGAAPKEQALIAALARRYAPDLERPEADQAYAAAMREVAATYPDDHDIAALFVEALMDTQPWDYWEADRQTPKGHAAEAVAVTERVLAAEPNHPAAIHLYIHLLEASHHAKQAEAPAERLGALMPASGHLVHMPSHIYYKAGRYKDSLAANEAAVAADERVLAASAEPGVYSSGYYPHNVHFVLVSAQMAGKADTALAAAEKLPGIIAPEVAREVPWVQAILTARYTAAAQLADAGTVLGLPDPGDEFPLVKAAWHYARGVALAQQGELAEAQAEVDAIVAIGRANPMEDLAAWGIPGQEVLLVARHVILARIAQQAGDLGRAADELRAASALQDGFSYMEPPWWYYPVRQTLGAVLLAAGEPEQAAEAFTAALAEAPNNAWSLWGLMRAQQAMGDAAAAKVTGELFEAAWAGDLAGPKLEQL